MSGMDQFLAEYYGTNASAPVSEEVEKQAQVELFTKLAADNGIDLNRLSDDQVNGLWAEFQGELAKTAGEDKEDEKKKVEEAAKEHEEKKAAAEKFAEADFLGRVMAHSYVSELKKIAGDDTKTLVDIANHAPRANGAHGTQRMNVNGGKMTQAMTADKVRAARELADKPLGERLKHHLGNAGEAVKEFGSKGVALAKRHPFAAAGIAAGTGLAAGAAAHHALSDGKKKKASALDEIAAEYALAKAAEAGFDVDEAAGRLGAILTLGVTDEGSKVAFAQDLNGAVEVRSLELLEQAGYPVQWAE